MTQPVGHAAFLSWDLWGSLEGDDSTLRGEPYRGTKGQDMRLLHLGSLGWLRSGKRRKRGEFNEVRTRFRFLHRYRRDRLGSRRRRSRRRQTQARTSKAANRKNVLQRENVLRQECLHDEGQVRRQAAYENARGLRKAAAVMTAVEDDEGDRVV